MIQLYDTTLRDGSQGEGVSFTVNDKLRVARRLDSLGIHFIEGGWPGSNPKDIDFFARAAEELHLSHARLCAFGSTRRRGMQAAEDPLVVQLAESGAPVVTIFGKTWLLHVREVIRVQPDENLEMIRDTVAFLRSRGLDVIYDAEHFFDGYFDDQAYALATLQAAAEGGAETLVLCDTNGGRMPWEITAATRAVIDSTSVRVGIHTHNDCELGVANTVAAVREGAAHVQGTMNGFGERTGNANLCSIIPILKLKMGIDCVDDEELRRLTEASLFVNETANVHPHDHQPFVGRAAFAHKAGTHADAVRKNPFACEHIDPELVGNRRRILVSELSGGSTIVWKAEEAGIELDKRAPETRQVLEQIARLESQGYVFEGAEASFELLLRAARREYRRVMELLRYRVILSNRRDDPMPITEAIVKLQVRDRLGVVHETHVAAEGDGPVHALDRAIRRALEPYYPEIRKVSLSDYKVRVVDGKEGTAARVRVLVESTDHEGAWTTTGVSENIIKASWEALADALEYALLRYGIQKPVAEEALAEEPPALI